MYYTNSEILQKARERARKANLPMPQTRDDVESLVGFTYNGPEPRIIGKTFTVPVRTWVQ